MRVVKRTKKRFLSDRYRFEAVAIETAGTYRERKNNVVGEIGRSLIEETGDQLETLLFIQKLSLVVQRGDAGSIFCNERERQRYYRSYNFF